MKEFKVFSIGKIINKETNICISLESKYSDGLKNLDGYSHIQVIWWADNCDNEQIRATLVEEKPYKNGPESIGVFALRSPERPNPIAISNAEISYVDSENGVIGLYYIDAFDNTPVLDIKPYTPSIDRIEHPEVPQRCRHWPISYEESGDFPWENEFNF